jgi:AraC-like DNA-binding protein
MYQYQFDPEIHQMLINFYNICGLRVGIHAPDMTILTEYPKKSEKYENYRFCDRVRYYSDIFTERCSACDIAAFNHVNTTKKAYIYRCHLGFMEALIPITVDGEIICAIMIGQVRDQNINLTPEEMRAFLLSVDISDTVFNDMIQSYQTMYTMNVSRFEALVYFLEICAQSIYDNRWIRRGEQSISEKFKDYTHTNLYNEISIFEAASALNISVSHLSRIIARDLNTTFTKYLNRQRMEVARLLLRTTKMNVNEIAMHLCYNDSAYFMRLFKRDTGITCTQYRASAPQLPKQQSADPF